VWSSTVDSSRINQTGPAPEFTSEHGVVTRLDLMIYVEAGTGASDSLAGSCAQVIQYSGKPDDTHCLYVQWQMDVPADYAAEQANITPGPILTPAGRQIDQGVTQTGLPGAKGVGISVYYAGGEPGSTLRWDVGSNELGYETVVYDVPPRDDFMPINFT
jgi:hypothetical protein